MISLIPVGSQNLSPKFEIRNSKQIQNPKSETQVKAVPFRTFGFGICFGFRASDFRISIRDPVNPKSKIAGLGFTLSSFSFPLSNNFNVSWLSSS